MKCYRCQQQLSAADVTCPSCGQAVFTTAGASSAAFGRRLDGCLEEPSSPQDFTAVPNLSSLPRQVDLREHCSPVEDQGSVGSCVANAAVGAVEYQHRKNGRVGIDLSRMFVYFNARRMRGAEQEDCGTTVAAGLAAFLAFGAPPESCWPYDPALVAREPGADVFEQALEYAPTEYARISGLENVQGALARGFPVVFAASLPLRCYQDAGRTGVMPTPDDRELAEVRTKYGRHAMLLAGYDTNDRTFLVRNSWGRDWGTGGYCRLGFDAFSASLAADTTWILGNLERSGAFTISRPGLTLQPLGGSVKDMAAKMRDELRGSLMTDMERTLRDIRNRVNPPRGNG